MRRHVCLAPLLFVVLTACSSVTAPTPTQPVEILPAIQTIEPLPSITPEAILTATLTATLNQSQLPSPTPTFTQSPSPEPSPSPTLVGGGSGIVFLETCQEWYDCNRFDLSLATLQLEPSSQPYLKLDVITLDPLISQLAVHDPSTQKTQVILECPDDVIFCYPMIFSGDMQKDWVYVALKYQHKLYDGNQLVDLYRLNTASLEPALIDQFNGSIRNFYPLSGGPQGLFSIIGNDFRAELLLYNIETFEQLSIIERKGQILLYGSDRTEQVFWHRMSDYCETELISPGGQRMGLIKNSDGIISWIDNETFLIFTATNNPPICTHTGIALANRYGLTGQWITSTYSNWSMLSPDRKTIYFTNDCNSRGCRKLMAANLDGSDDRIIIESLERFTGYPVNGLVSPDGTKILFSTGKQIWMLNADGSNPHIILDTAQEWQIIGWRED